MGSRLSIVTVALLAALIGWNSLSIAAEIPVRRSRRVAIWPVQHLDAPCEQLFSPGSRGTTQRRFVGRYLRQALNQSFDVKVKSLHELRRGVTNTSNYKDQVVLGRERYHMGHEYYRDLRQPEAAESLIRSIEMLDSIFYDAVEPQAFSEILFLLGITLVEESRAAEAHQAFKRALFLSPMTTFSPGFHPHPVEQALSVACEDLQRSLEKELPMGTQERTFDFMRKQKLDILFYPLVVTENGSAVLRLLAWDGKAKNVVVRERIPLADEAEAAQAIGRAVSRWAACTPYENIPRQVEERNRWVFSANYQHLLFLKQPLRNPLFMMGFSFDGAHFFKRSFAILVKAQFLSSLPDEFEDLVDGFTSARLTAGPALSISGNWWRLFVSPSLEFHYMGSFSVTRDPNCKHFLNDSPGAALCLPGAVKQFPVDFLAGINTSIGAQFFVADEMFISAGASISTYFAPFDRTFEMNFPVAVEAGGGVAF
jgi:hypothetical protein